MVIQLYSDIVPRAGGTYVCEDGIPQMVKWLYDHPEGTDMREGSKTAYDSLGECKIWTEVSEPSAYARLRADSRPGAVYRQSGRRDSLPSLHRM